MAKKISKRSKHSAKPARRALQAEEHSPARRKARAQESSAENWLFPVVGVGASAGGLEAFAAFLQHLPADSGMAFVLIAHLDPKQPSHLADLLSKVTRMPVLEIKADTPLRPNHVYVMGSGVCLSMSDGKLRAEEREGGWNLPIDYFLRSLAQTRGSKAIGVVLSGTASDGTMGLKAVKTEGGVTFAQEPSSAKFDGMPRSAIAAGVVDFVLSVQEIAKRLVRLTQHPSYVALKSGEDEEGAEKTKPELDTTFKVLRTVTGNDFTHYKHTTIRRRIQRRMALRSSETLSEYVAYLQENAAEVRALADDLLICVTAFFRDEETLQALDARIFPEMVKDKNAENPIRIWVPGCATGEEAYSIAIRLTEFQERSGVSVPMRIFATDMSEAALEKARSGIYSMSALAEVSPARLKRFFVRAKGGYQIAKPIRATCVFATQNVIKDPPFYNLDLISCCNVLIYFGPVLQKKALSTFHYALKPGGILMLGPAESVSPLSQAFSPLGKKLKLYVNQPRAHLLTNPRLPAQPAEEASTALMGGGNREALNIQKTAERMLLTQYAPAAVIVDDALNIVHVRGETGPYLQLASGEPTYSLPKMAREGLVVGLRMALLKAKQRKASVSEQARVKHNGEFKDVNIRVTPINDPSAPALHFLVVFEDDVALPVARGEGNGKERQQPTDSAKPAKTSIARVEHENARLKKELAATGDYLQSIIEEQEASTEELKSANEEAQATNEELETSKEELQSSNEELNTVNDELKTRNVALSELNHDLANVLGGINVPLVMVGKDLNIRRFTPSMEPVLNLIESDVGRPIADLKPNIDVPDLVEMLRSVIHGATPRTREVQGPKAAWFSLQILPYKVDAKIEGALLVLLDIDAVKRGRNFAEAIIETVRQPLLVLSTDLQARYVNRAFYEFFKVRKKDTLGHFIGDLGNGQWNIPKLLDALKRILPEKGGFEGFRVEHEFENIGRRTMILNAREVQPETPFGGPAILLAIEDITEQQRLTDSLTSRVDQSEEVLASTQTELRELTRRLIVAQEEERGRIARELHDNLVQRTVVIDLELEPLGTLLQPSAQGALSAARGHLSELSADLRKVSHQLHPSAIDDLGLPVALKGLIRELNNNGGDIVFVERKGRNETTPSLSVEQATNLYRIAQEALQNANKHAPGSQVRMVLATTNQQLRLSIEDTGPGFNLDETLNGGGLGLLSMRERAKILGANLTVRTKPGSGTQIIVQIRTLRGRPERKVEPTNRQTR